jgi:SAM-dependent methyltransferase
MLIKFGKKADMYIIQGRDFEKKHKLMLEYKKWSEKALIPYNENNEYKCRICNCKKFDKFVDIYGFYYVQCEECESIILLNLPDVKTLYNSEESTMADVFLNDEYFISRTKNIGLPKAEFVLNSIENNNPHNNHNKNNQDRNLPNNQRKWCDIGCGVGEMLMALKKYLPPRYNIEGIGIESDPREIEFGRGKGLNIVNGFLDPDNPNMELLEIISNADIVSMFMVLEHMEYPNRIIDLLKITMKEGSFLIIEVPRHPSLASFVNLISPQFTYRHIIPPVHLQVFSEKAIKKLTKDTFEIIATWGFGQGYTDILTNSMLLGKTNNLDLYNDLMKISNEVQKIIDENGYSDDMIFVMKKK